MLELLQCFAVLLPSSGAASVTSHTALFLLSAAVALHPSMGEPPNELGTAAAAAVEALSFCFWSFASSSGGADPQTSEYFPGFAVLLPLLGFEFLLLAGSEKLLWGEGASAVVFLGGHFAEEGSWVRKTVHHHAPMGESPNGRNGLSPLPHYPHRWVTALGFFGSPIFVLAARRSGLATVCFGTSMGESPNETRGSGRHPVA